MIRSNRDTKSEVDFEIAVTMLSVLHPKLLPQNIVAKVIEESIRYAKNYRKVPKVRTNNLAHLKEAYSSARKNLLYLFFNNTSMVGDYCVYCGKVDPEELDHFFSRSKYPQYSITSLNLVWACKSCNSSKGSRCPVGYWGLHHPIKDKIFESHQLLFNVVFKSVVKDDEGAFAFQLNAEPISKISAAKKKKIRRIIDKLDITSRITGRINRELNVIISTFVKPRNSSQKQSLLKRNRRKASSALKRHDFEEYFAYSILSKSEVLDQIFI